MGAGAPDMGHVIHQNYRLVEAYRDHKKKLTKSIFLTMATLKLDDFAYFFSIFVAPTFVQLNVNSKLLVATPALCL